MPSERELAEQRRRNRTVYALEDYRDARSGLRYTALGNLALAAVVALGILSGTDGPEHVIAAALTGLLLLLAPRFLVLERLAVLYLLFALYTLGIILEYLLADLPSPPFPYLTVENGWVGFIPFANSLFPLLYVLARAALIYPLINLYLKRRDLAAQPLATLRQLDRELAAKFE
ncbi:hypothetical protein [Lewinella sp. IMCC34183]|uniref:hypothetical protein n=1 Tax=Lewinella sp. IMCC34183 TaxID=2248762 RepID=UPI000E275C70|nr:hypothetical protein [Lewinella sp. IMCC34183]